MNCLTQALGLGLADNGTIPAITAARIRLAKEGGVQIIELVNQDERPRQIATQAAFKNAIAVDMALGCSTNTVLHVPAIAYEAGIKLDLDLCNAISARAPHLCSLRPAGHPYRKSNYFSFTISQFVSKVLSKAVYKNPSISPTPGGCPSTIFQKPR